MHLVVSDVKLVLKEKHRSINTVGDTLDDEAVNIVLVGKPLVGLLVRLNVVLSVLHESVNFLTVVADVFEAGANESLVGLFDILSEESLILALVEGFGPLVHDINHFANIFLHFLDELVNFSDYLHCLVDEGVDVLRVPLKLGDARVQGVQHHLDAVLKQGLLNRQKGC